MTSPETESGTSPRKTGISRGILATLSIVGMILLWEFLAWFFAPTKWLLPAPSDIIMELATYPLWYLDHALYTLRSATLWFLIALSVGVLAAIGIVYSRVLESTIYTFIVSINSIPKIALAPLFIIWLGTGINSKLAISALSAL